MKAAVLYEVGAPLKIDEVQLDEPQANEILVKLVATGVCHTDLHFMKGEMPAPVPVIPGHEGAGIVEKVGPGVTTVKPGDHVIMMVAFNCGKCRYCYAGRPTMCVENLPIQMMATLPYGQMRIKKDGKPVHQMFGLACYAEKVIVHERSAVKIRPDAPLEVACLLGKVGETMAIFGCGGVGLSAVMGAKLAGAKVIAIDTLDNKLAMAKELGADYIVNAKKDDPQLKIFEILGGGADYALEFIGNVDVMVKALGSIRPGGLFVVSGMAPLTSMLTIAPFEFLLGKTITGAVQGDIIPQIDIPKYVDLYMQGKLPIDKLITKTYRLDQINEAFEAMKKGEVLRGVIKF
jgi:S-(hydroxymethyl)glutathione dehydrogenase/alcohol dehydrogenase